MDPQENILYEDLGNIKKNTLKSNFQILENTTDMRRSYDPKENTCGLKEYQEASQNQRSEC